MNYTHLKGQKKELGNKEEVESLAAEPLIEVVRLAEMAQGKGVFEFNPISRKKGRIWVFLASIQPGEYIPPHIHLPNTETYIYLISGQLEQFYGNRLSKTVIYEQGDFLFVPGNVPHQPTNLSLTDPVKAILICDYDQNDLHHFVPYDPKTDTLLWDYQGHPVQEWQHLTTWDMPERIKKLYATKVDKGLNE